MTVNEAIELSCGSFPAELEREALCIYLTELEARIATELFGKQSEKITADAGEKVLTAPDAYAELYPAFLMMQRELSCGDAERYSFYKSAFEAAYERYACYINRQSPTNGVSRITTV